MKLGKLLSIGLLGASLLQAEVNFNDKRIVEDIGLSSFYKNIDELKSIKERVGIWYLYRYHKRTFNKVKEDEFEYYDAVDNYFNKFIELNKENKFIGQTSSIMLGSNFSKYDFKKQRYPVNAMGKDSYLIFDGTYDNGVNNIWLKFDNINKDYSYIPMDRSQAKEFKNSRKSSSGRIDRNLAIKYHFTIKEVTNNGFGSFEECEFKFGERYPSWCKDIEGYSDGSHRDKTVVTVIGHINKMEIMDNQGNILHTYDKF